MCLRYTKIGKSSLYCGRHTTHTNTLCGKMQAVLQSKELKIRYEKHRHDPIYHAFSLRKNAVLTYPNPAVPSSGRDPLEIETVRNSKTIKTLQELLGSSACKRQTRCS
jgi:hypothetical protein